MIVKISSKYQVVIPQKVREELHIKPGEKFQIIVHGDRIELVPVKNVGSMRGFLKGIDTNIERDDDRI